MRLPVYVYYAICVRFIGPALILLRRGSPERLQNGHCLSD
jgi:hypothetical protein